jgi:ribosomal protein L11 methyltransferase
VVASSGRQQSARRSTEFVRIRVGVRDPELSGRVAAEAYAEGAVGLEERTAFAGGVLLDLYVPEARSAEVARAAAGVPGVEVSKPEAVSEVDWSEAWKEGLRSVVISSHLRVSPLLSASPPARGDEASEVWIEPGQAFGIGGHASTRLALEWIAQAARANARVNGLAGSLWVSTGTLAALTTEAEAFDLVVANLLRTEMVPWLDEIARRTRTGGRVVLSGLLGEERAEMGAALADVGLRVRGERLVSDADGADWISLCSVRG